MFLGTHLGGAASGTRPRSCSHPRRRAGGRAPGRRRLRRAPLALQPRNHKFKTARGSLQPRNWNRKQETRRARFSWNLADAPWRRRRSVPDAPAERPSPPLVLAVQEFDDPSSSFPDIFSFRLRSSIPPSPTPPLTERSSLRDSRTGARGFLEDRGLEGEREKELLRRGRKTRLYIYGRQSRAQGLPLRLGGWRCLLLRFWKRSKFADLGSSTS